MDSGGISPVSLGRSSSLRTYSANRTSLVRRNQSLSAKQIRFYRNGDRYFAGLKLAVSTERYKEFDSLLAELSEKLNLSTGAVRYIFNADDNSMITDISQLQYGIPYVCSSSNTFRQIEGGYGKHLHSWSIIAKSKQHNSNKFNGHLENINGNFRLDTSRDFIKPKLVTVIRNGKPPQKKVTLLLNTKTAISLDQVLDQLSAKGSLGKVDKLYTVDGRSIKTLRDLFEDDTVFIALSTNEKFPDDGIELDPNSYRITPYRELKRPSCMTVRRSNSLRGSIRRYKDENENMSISKIAKGLRSNHGVHSAKSAQKVARPRGSALKKIDQNKEELYPTSVFESDSDSDCQYDLYSMFGIKKDKQSVHSTYKIGRIIGDGNFAIVRECRDRKSQKPFALKIINKSKVKGKEHMIENEILILRRISHANIVKLHEEFETPKEIYLVMELVEGGDLFDAIVANTRFSEPESAYMIRDLSSAVQYLHMLNIVHRDIKPENLLVVNRTDGRKSIKLADFGLSIEVKSQMFLVCGTPTYVAPEILDESGYGLKVDVWAIGVISYILLCGFPPFRSANHDQEELFDKIMRGDFEYLAPFWDDISDEPRDLIDRLLVVDPSERFDATEILQHFWIKKWTEPIEKIQRQLTEAEEANFKTRKRLRGIALAITSVISLLHYVRFKNKTNELNRNIKSNILSNKSSPSISRIPRPKPQAGSHIVEIRKSITTPIRRRAPNRYMTLRSDKPSKIPPPPAPDYSLKKGFLKREEAIQRSLMKMNDIKTAAKNKASNSPVHKHVKFRPASVIDVREKCDRTQSKRPSSAQAARHRLTKQRSVPSPAVQSKERTVECSPRTNSDNVPGDCKSIAPNGVKLRKKTRPRPRSMLGSTSCMNINEFLDNDCAQQTHPAVKPATGLRDSSKTRPNRPVSLMLVTNSSQNNLRQKALTPMTAESNLKMAYKRSIPNFSFDKHENTPQEKNRSKPTGNNISQVKEKHAGKIAHEKKADKKPTARSNSVSGCHNNRSRSPTRKSSVSRGHLSFSQSPSNLDLTKSPRRSTSRSRLNSSTSSGSDSPITRRKSSDQDINPPWNPSTKPRVGLRGNAKSPSSSRIQQEKKSPPSRRNSIDQNSKSIRITTEINKRKNIKFPDGKTVDKETKTTTTVSLDVDTEQTEAHVSLLSKVKNLAQEIEILSKSDDYHKNSDSSSDSINANLFVRSTNSRTNSDLHQDVIKEEMDRFSETEYLSIK